jgi:hypothetical protein
MAALHAYAEDWHESRLPASLHDEGIYALKLTHDNVVFRLRTKPAFGSRNALGSWNTTYECRGRILAAPTGSVIHYDIVPDMSSRIGRLFAFTFPLFSIVMLWVSNAPIVVWLFPAALSVLAFSVPWYLGRRAQARFEKSARDLFELILHASAESSFPSFVGNIQV